MDTKRIIKFRFWDKKFKSMSNGHTLKWWIENSATAAYCVGKAEMAGGDSLDNSKEWSRENRIALEWTGLTDKNGKEIYESDRVKDIDGSIFLIEWSEDHLSFQAIPEVKTIHFVTIGIEHLKPCEVIGNKFENPELIK